MSASWSKYLCLTGRVRARASRVQALEGLTSIAGVLDVVKHKLLLSVHVSETVKQDRDELNCTVVQAQVLLTLWLLLWR